MTVETQARFISELNQSFPRSKDLIKEGDDHIRLVKNVLKTTMPKFTSSLTISSDKLNKFDEDIVYDADTITIAKDFLFLAETGITLEEGTIGGVVELDDDNAVEPRIYNDARYLQVEKNFEDIADKDKAITNLFTDFAKNEEAIKVIQAALLPLVYPVGSLYFQSENNTNPRDLLGFGVWSEFGSGRVIIGSGSLNDGVTARTFTNKEVGGFFNHTLTVHEMPSHNHTYTQLQIAGPSPDTKHGGLIAQYGYAGYATDYTGGNGAHNNMQPYVTVNVWKRVT
ncbi:MAG: phage baseplate protein [Cetobacterium sp.]|uniref:phage tail protein n=1 Tax=Cetobacterium sp. TaxID=2071632 RepID=UPI003EE64567